MAGETRRQRRDARRAAGQEPARSGRPAAVPAGPTPTPAVEHHARRGGFVRESVAELKKVEWPTRAQVIQGTIVVIIACAIVGAYLWGADQILKPFVRDVLLGQ
jgi:preprotein translocase subunit SecE